MSRSIEVEGPLLGQSAVCAPILEGLPEWFGIAEANAQYVRDIEVLPTFIARDGDEVVGFLTVKRHYPESAEVLVMGVRADRIVVGLVGRWWRRRRFGCATRG